jgi:hypothetical protein
MLLHVRINTAGSGTSEEAALRDHENNVLLKNRAIESLMDPSVDASPNTVPNLTYCNRFVVYGKGEIKHIRWSQIPEDATVCEVCRTNSSSRDPHIVTYILDEQTAPM